MDILTAAVVALALAVLNFVPAVGFETVRHVLLLIITVYIIVRAYSLSQAFKNGSKTVLVGSPSTHKGEETAANGSQKTVSEASSASGHPVSTGGDALVLLSLLQEKGRFLDFVTEDITSFSDGQIAAASRVVHQGCAAVFRECLSLAPVHAGKEGDEVSIAGSDDPREYRLLGRVAAQPPYNGVVLHRGWKTSKISIPRATRPVDPQGDNIIAPVEVEVR